MRTKFYIILLFGCLFWTVIRSNAQIDEQIYVCLAEDGVPESSKLLVLRDASATGFIFPTNMELMFYSDEPLSIGLYTINPDTATGGYRSVEHLSTTQSGRHLPVELGCLTELATLGVALENKTISLPIPVSTNHAVMVTRSETLIDLNAPHISGVMLISFQDASTFSFQLLQTNPSEATIDLQFPFLPSSTPFVLIANKSFSYLISLIEPDGTEIFDSRQNSAARRFIIPQLLSIRNIDLFELLVNTKTRIYPEHGANNNYLGGYLRIEFGAGEAERQPPFEVGAEVSPIENIEVEFFPLGRPDEVLGRIHQGSERYVVERIEDNGDLTLKDPQGLEINIPAWLVQAQSVED